MATGPKGVGYSDRVRESLFSSLGQFFDGGAVLDLYAGTGALGIEALSRGIDRAVFVERDRKVRAVILKNLRRTRFIDRAEVIGGEVEAVLGWLEGRGEAFDLIFADPPYRIASAEVGGISYRLRSLLAPGGRVIVESGEAPVEVAGGRKGVTRRYGGTFITILGRSELTMIVAVCPGSFDPVTTGHLMSTKASEIRQRRRGRRGRRASRLAARGRRARLMEGHLRLDKVSVEVMTVSRGFARGRRRARSSRA